MFFSRAFLGITIDDSIVFLSQFMEGVAGWWGAGAIKGGGGGHTILQNGKTYNVRIRQTKRSMGDPIKREK